MSLVLAGSFLAGAAGAAASEGEMAPRTRVSAPKAALPGEVPVDDTVEESFAGTQELIIEARPGKTRSLVRELTALGVTVTDQYDTALAGAAVTVTEDQLEAIRDTVYAKNITADVEVHLFDTSTQGSAPWNLDRTDQQDYTSSGAVGTYTYPTSAGEGVTVYVIDSGFTRQNDELDGRVGAGVDFIGGDHGTPSDPSDDTSVRDCNQHGTHVAGTVASTTYGVAKSAMIVPVRVFGCDGDTTASAVLNGIEWVIENRPPDAPAVINMSLGAIGGYSLIDQATQNAIDAGITVVVAAGNGGYDDFGDDACFGSVNSAGDYENGTSPARVVDAITVGATGYGSPPQGSLQDVEHYFSNYGTCVDLLAPGGNVTSLSYNSPDPLVLSGTSMASPLVAGVAALYLSANPLATPAQVQQAIVENAAVNKITYAHNFWPNYLEGYPAYRPMPTNNRLVNTEFLLLPTNSGIPGAPTNLMAGTATATSVALTWNEPSTLNGSTLTDYLVQFRVTGAVSWSTFIDGETSETGTSVTGLSASTGYQFRVAALTSGESGTFAAAVSSVTLSGVTTAPQNLVAGTATASSVPLTWTAPVSLNGGTVTDYRVQYRPSGSSIWLTFNDEVSPTTGATVTGLRASRKYQFQVSARTEQGFSAYTSSVTRNTLSGRTTAPRSLVAGTPTATAVPLTWTAPLALNGGTITDYRVQYRLSGVIAWSTFPDTVSATTGATVTGLSPSRSYQFQVAARTVQGFSANTAVVTSVTPSGVTTTPQGLVAGTATVSSVPLTWGAPVTLNGGTVTDYRVQYRRTGSTIWLTFTDPVSATTGVTVTGLSASWSYQFQVSAGTAQGFSAYTALVTRSTLSGRTTAPQGLAAGTASASSVPLTWSAPVNLNGGTITDYRVQYRLVGAKRWSTFTDGVSATTGATVTGLSSSRSYQFQVAARTVQGYSANTVAVTSMTPPSVTTVPTGW